MKSWLNKWFSFSWKKLVLVAVLIPVMWVASEMKFQKVDAFVRDSLQSLNNNDNIEKSIVTVNMNLKNEVYKRPLSFEPLRTVIQKILDQKPKHLIICFSPLEINGNEDSIDLRQELFNFLKFKENVYIYSSFFSDKNDFNVDEIFKKFPRMIQVTMINDASPERKRRRAIVHFDKIGEAPEFKEIRKLGFTTKTSKDFPYGLRYWGTTQPYLKTHSLETFGAHDAFEVIQNNFTNVDLQNKTVILGTADEYSMLNSESVFNLFWPVGASGYKDFPASDSLANYINFYVKGDYIKLLQNFKDVLITTLLLIVLIFLNIKLKYKLFILMSIIPFYLVTNVIMYALSSFYINFSLSIVALFFIQYFGIPIIMFSMFKQQESKKLQEINDARIDALLTVSEKVAHDIRSPLSAINLVMTKASFPEQEYKEIFDSAVQRIDETANKILTRYRTKTGSEDETPEPIDLGEVCNSIIKEKTILNEKIHFELVVNTDSTMALGLKLDLERIISNIMDNSVFALKSIIEPKIFISIDEHDNLLRLSITDNGSGIPEKVLSLLGTARITTKADTGQGNGIGLLHAKRVIERLKGKFEISSQENVGTTINISLPKA